MNLPLSCHRCRQPLTVASGSGLCLSCLLELETSNSGPTLHNVLDSSFATGSFIADRAPTATLDPKRRANLSSVEAPDGQLPLSPLGYELLCKLGHGGMGEVYLARDHSADRMVAMKFLRGSVSQGMARFFREVRAQGRLDHTNIVRVLSTDFNRSDPYFTMEYASRGTLSDRVKDHGPLPPGEAAAAIAMVARAVHAAHKADVLHRDLKPSNLLVMDDGTLKISDFGLAKRTDVDETLTASDPIGTPSFMPPEQASPKFGEIGPRSDVYSLGATLYYLVTGSPPFNESRSEAIIIKLLTELPERPRAIRPDLPADLEGIIVKCLEKNPSARYESAAALAEDLDRFLAGQAPKAPPLTPWRRLRRWAARNRRHGAIGLAATAGLLAITLAMAPVQHDPPEPSPDLTPAQVVEQIQDELRAGRSVTLIGRTGRPKYARFLLEPNGLADDDDKPCSFHAFRHSLLELCPDPGVDRYRVSLELQHRDAAGLPPSGQLPQDFVGFYFGYSAGPVQDGTVSHLMFAALYKDYDLKAFLRKAPGESFVRFWKLGIVHQPGANPSPSQWEVAARKFTTPPERPGPWRQLVVEVTPERVLVRWREKEDLITLIDWKGDRVRAEYRDRQNTLAESVPGIEHVLPDWSPRMPLGIFSSKAAVSVRNVVISPLPSLPRS